MVQFLRAYLGWQLPMDRPARRFDFGFGRVHYLKYFLAQVELYRPSWRHVGTSGTSSIAEVPPTACLFPINMATLRVLGLPVMNWMIRQISRRSSSLVFYCHPREFVHSYRQSFPRNMSKWNKQSMHPQNMVLLEAFVEYIGRLGYDSTVFSDLASMPLDSATPVVLRAPVLQEHCTHTEEGSR